MSTSNYRPLDYSSTSDFQSKTAGEDHHISGAPKKNKYAFACAILASMTSVLLGYGIFYLFAHIQCYAHFVYSV